MIKFDICRYNFQNILNIFAMRFDEDLDNASSKG